MNTYGLAETCPHIGPYFHAQSTACQWSCQYCGENPSFSEQNISHRAAD